MRQWILLRGLTRESAHWGGFAADFGRALPHDKVLALDLPGNGVFRHQPSPPSVPAMVHACRAALAQQGIAPPYHLLAMSLGAMVATEWAQRGPAEVAGCVLINTSLRPFNPFYRRLRPRNYLALLRMALAGMPPLQAEQQVLRLTSNCAPHHQPVVPEWAAIRTQRPVSAANALRQLLAAARYRAPVARPVQPTLLLASRRDGLVHGQCSQAIASAWQAPVAFHPWAGHDLPLDDPGWVIAQVLGWLGDARAG